MLLTNCIPALLVISAIAAFFLCGRVSSGAIASLGIVYIAPPVLVRFLFRGGRRPEGCFSVDSGEFRRWWTSSQLQILFCRVPVLEELLRLIPGLYSGWLRLWGARIGRLAYWAPGVRILDRSYLDIGNDVVFGAGVRLNPHVFDPKHAPAQLAVRTISVGDGSFIGGYSLLTSGSGVAAGETLNACSILPPFSTFTHGRRERANRAA